MNSKITAQQLFNVVVDTNKKITALTAIQNSKSEAVEQPEKEQKKNSKFATTMVIILAILGAAMITSIFVPAMLEAIHMTFSEYVWKIVYVSFAAFTIIVATTGRINTPIRVITTVIAIAPLAITSILSII